jgi:hypothetical protein
LPQSIYKKQDTEKTFEYLTSLFLSASLKLKGDALVAERHTERTIRTSVQVAQDNLMATDLEGPLIAKAKVPFATVLVKRVSFFRSVLK